MNGRTLVSDGRAEAWPPDFDLHEEDGEMVVHAELDGLAEDDLDVALDGNVLVVRENGRDIAGGALRSARLALPFAPRGLRRVSRPRHDGLEVRLRIPEEVLEAAIAAAGAGVN